MLMHDLLVMATPTPAPAASAAPVVETLTNAPELVAALAVVFRLVLAYQRSLSWPEYRVVHRLLRGVLPLVDRYLWSRAIHAKGDRDDDDEYLCTLNRSIPEAVRTLRRGGASLHLLASVKRRPAGRGPRLSVAHCVWTHDDGQQTEAYLFRNHDGTVDVYAHHEASVTQPVEHLEGKQHDGDPRGVVRDALGDRND